MRRIVIRRVLERVRRYRGLRFRPPQSVWGTNGSVARADTGDVNRIRPLALPGTTTGLLLFVLTLLLGLALGLSSASSRRTPNRSNRRLQLRRARICR